MSRKREPMASNWAQDRLLRDAAVHLVTASAEEIAATADDLGVAPERLQGFVEDERRRKQLARG